MNSKLYDNAQGQVLIPKQIKDQLRNAFSMAKGANERTEGYTRNQELQSQESISYPQLKRIKNFFDNYQGKENEFPFILNGGRIMKNWVDSELNRMRNNVKDRNHSSKPDDSKITHSDIKNNVKDLARPSQQHKTTGNRHSTSIADVTVTESLKRIKELISKI